MKKDFLPWPVVIKTRGKVSELKEGCFRLDLRKNFHIEGSEKLEHVA